MKRYSWILLIASTALAAVVQFPYTNGKQGHSTELQVSSFHPLIGFSGYPILSDTIRIGNVFSLQFKYMAAQSQPSLCSMTENEFGKLFVHVSTAGDARQSVDTSTNWDGYATYPSVSALATLDSLPLSVAPSGGVGYILAKSGICEGASTAASGRWNRVIFIRNGTHYAKFAMVAKKDTSYGNVIPSYYYLQRITLRYIVNDMDDLSPVSIRPVRPERRGGRYGIDVAYDLYNPLGVRLTRGAGKYEPAVQTPRRP